MSTGIVSSKMGRIVTMSLLALCTGSMVAQKSLITFASQPAATTALPAGTTALPAGTAAQPKGPTAQPPSAAPGVVAAQAQPNVAAAQPRRPILMTRPPNDHGDHGDLSGDFDSEIPADKATHILNSAPRQAAVDIAGCII